MKLPMMYRKVFTMLASSNDVTPRNGNGEMPRTETERYLAANFRLTKDDVKEMLDELESRGFIEKDRMTITLSGLKKLSEMNGL